MMLFFAALLFLTSCSSETLASGDRSVWWATDSAWYQPATAVNPDKVDLLYLVSTDVVSAKTVSGEVSYVALLTPEDRKALDGEFDFVEKNIGQSDFNYFAPYYHQFTFDALNLPAEQFAKEYKKVAKEVCEAFDYYMEHKNQGRRFVLAGFSQGGMLVLDLLKHMTPEQYQKMVAAYALGYRLSADDVKQKHIIPATDETSTGVTISFNSVLKPEAIWPIVAGGAVACVNPVNWTTDATPATFTYEGGKHQVYIDEATQQLVVETERAEVYREWNKNPVFQSAHVSLDCLHHWDLLFYTNYIHGNMLKRCATLGVGKSNKK